MGKRNGDRVVISAQNGNFNAVVAKLVGGRARIKEKKPKRQMVVCERVTEDLKAAVIELGARVTPA